MRKANIGKPLCLSCNPTQQGANSTTSQGSTLSSNNFHIVSQALNTIPDMNYDNWWLVLSVWHTLLTILLGWSEAEVIPPHKPVFFYSKGLKIIFVIIYCNCGIMRHAAVAVHSLAVRTTTRDTRVRLRLSPNYDQWHFNLDRACLILSYRIQWSQIFAT